MRPVSLVFLSLAVTACSSAGGSAAPASNGPQASSVAFATASSAPSVVATETVAAATLAPSTASLAPGGGTGECPTDQLSGFQKYTLDGFEIHHYCGPATASVTLGSTTVQIAGGSCTTNAVGYSVAIGTQLFGSPAAAQEPDLLIITVNPTSGAGSISGVVAHKHWLLNAHPVAFGAGKLSGTFTGVSAFTGVKAHGSFTC
jgi:hypothetical protein